MSCPLVTPLRRERRGARAAPASSHPLPPPFVSAGALTSREMTDDRGDRISASSSLREPLLPSTPGDAADAEASRRVQPRPTSASGVPLMRVPRLYASVNGVSTGRHPPMNGASSGRRQRRGDDTGSDGDEDGDGDRGGRLRLAAEYVRDALDGITHLSFRRDHPMARAVARAQRSPLYAACLYGLLLAQLSLVFVEPNTRAAVGYPLGRRRWLAGAEAGAGVLFLLDALATVIRLGRERWGKKHWRLVYVVVAACVTVDCLVCLAALARAGVDPPRALLLRPTRALRPLLLIAHHRPMRHLVSSMLRTLPRLASTIALVGVVIVAYAALGVQLYAGAYDVDDVERRGNFDNAFDAAVAMMVLITVSNFPEIFRPALDDAARITNGVPRWASAVFFVSFIVIGVWLGMSLWVTVIFETYKQQHRAKIAKARVHEQKALITAYSILQDAPEQPLARSVWVALARRARPGLTLPAARALFAAADRDGDGQISVDEFLQTIDLLKSSVTRVGGGQRRHPRGDGQIVAGDEGGWTGTGTEAEAERRGASATNRLLETAVRAPRSHAFARWSQFLAAAQTLVLCLRHRGASAAFDAAVDRADVACVALLCVEVALRAVAAVAAPARDSSATSASDIGAFFGSHGVDVGVAAVSLATLAPGVPVRVARTFAPVRILRLLVTSSAQREIIHTFARCGEVIATLLACLLSVMYSYACVGMEAFSSQVTGPRTYCVPEDGDDQRFAPNASSSSSSSSSSSVLPCLDPLENFEDPWRALLSLFQVTTTNNWNDVMYPNVAALAVAKGDPGRVMGVFYFVSFYVVTVLLLVNILTSLVMEMFGLTWRAQRRRAEEDRRAVEGLGEGEEGQGAERAERIAPRVSQRSRTLLVADAGGGDQWSVTRSNDWAKDLMLENLCIQSERAALEADLEQLEAQLARQQSGRAAEAFALLRRERGRNDPLTEDDAAADLLGEIRRLSEEDRSHVAMLMGQSPGPLPSSTRVADEGVAPPANHV